MQADWQSVHQVRALAKNGQSQALGELATCQKQHLADFKKVMKVLRLIGQSDRVRNEHHVKRGKRHRDVYELRGGQMRLFFFYTPDNKEVVVCTHCYWKAKGSEAEQDRQFELCDRLRQEYLKSIGDKPQETRK